MLRQTNTDPEAERSVTCCDQGIRRQQVESYWPEGWETRKSMF